MSFTENDSSLTSPHDADEWGQYRSLSTLSVIALLLGLCSALAFVSPLMFVVPLAAVAAALLAWKRIVSSDGNLSGSRLACAGLALAVLFASASLARVQFRDRIMRGQADSVAQQWLSFAAKGSAEQMLELMTKEASEKISPAAAPGQPTSFFGGMLASALLRQDPLVVGLKQQDGGVPRFRLQDAEVVTESNPPQAVFRYLADTGAEAPQTCLLVLKRYRASKAEYTWLIDSWAVE